MTTTTADQATIGKSLVIKGEVTGSESLYIDGRVEGSINLSGNRVTVGRNGVVAANINAREIVVLGKVRGNLTASDRVDIRSDGSLTGDVIAARISIEDGAFFKGGIDIRKGGQPQRSRRPTAKTKPCLRRAGSSRRPGVSPGNKYGRLRSGHLPGARFVLLAEYCRTEGSASVHDDFDQDVRHDAIRTQTGGGSTTGRGRSRRA